MQVTVLNDSKNELEFALNGERHTLPSLLREQLLKDSSVEFVAYNLKHPLSSESKFIVKTSGKTAKKAVAEAIKGIEEDLNEFKKNVKALK